jgi:CheY-like chemotaxis protein
VTRPLRVLVAEDDPDHRFFIRRALEDIEDVSVEVVTVEDGAEALDLVHRRGAYADQPAPDLILLDLRMPRRSGLEVLDELKSDPTLRTIPVSILSSSDRAEDVLAAYRLGGNAYLRKRGLRELRADLGGAMRFWGQIVVLPTGPA